ncbi:MFS transporter [Calorimonas adulescens]|uniref:MFS transporter n=1 Tax=Calorimonas adulescens TaxID=2606906 RepID=A0A5D8QBF8_9THEO|nr:MFS transporter [Calorimonas adulescens]
MKAGHYTRFSLIKCGCVKYTGERGIRVEFKYAIGNFGIFYINTTISTFFVMVFRLNGIQNPAILFGTGLLMGAFIQPLIGIISDIYISKGRKIFIILGVLICVISTLLLFSKKGNIIFNVILFYIGFHLYQIPLSAFIPDNIEEDKLNTVSGLWNATGSLGSIVAPILGTIMLQKGYNYLFLGMFIVIIISAGIPLVLVKEKKGQFYNNNVINSLIIYLTDKNVRNFYISKCLWWGGLGAFLPFIMENLIFKGVSADEAGKICTVFMIFNCISSIFISRVKLGSVILPLAIALITFSGCNLLFYISSNIKWIFILIPIFGVSYGTIMVCSYNLMIRMIPKGEGGMYLGFDNIFVNIPQAISAFLVSSLAIYDKDIFLIISSSFMALACIYIYHSWDIS